MVKELRGKSTRRKNNRKTNRKTNKKTNRKTNRRKTNKRKTLRNRKKTGGDSLYDNIKLKYLDTAPVVNDKYRKAIHPGSTTCNDVSLPGLTYVKAISGIPSRYTIDITDIRKALAVLAKRLDLSFDGTTLCGSIITKVHLRYSVFKLIETKFEKLKKPDKLIVNNPPSPLPETLTADASAAYPLVQTGYMLGYNRHVHVPFCKRRILEVDTLFTNIKSYIDWCITNKLNELEELDTFIKSICSKSNI